MRGSTTWPSEVTELDGTEVDGRPILVKPNERSGLEFYEGKPCSPCADLFVKAIRAKAVGKVSEKCDALMMLHAFASFTSREARNQGPHLLGRCSIFHQRGILASVPKHSCPLQVIPRRQDIGFPRQVFRAAWLIVSSKMSLAGVGVPHE